MQGSFYGKLLSCPWLLKRVKKLIIKIPPFQTYIGLKCLVLGYYILELMMVGYELLWYISHIKA
jgi:hypothetical protein